MLIVDAILDDDGPMRYGCDPLSIGLLDLWRQSDDETMFELTGRSLLDLVELRRPVTPGSARTVRPSAGSSSSVTISNGEMSKVTV